MALRYAVALFAILAATIAALSFALSQSATIHQVFRINARHLGDSRVEVSVEHWDGEQWARHEPANRYLPAEHDAGEWFNSDPFVVSIPLPEHESGQQASASPVPPDDWSGWNGWFDYIIPADSKVVYRGGLGSHGWWIIQAPRKSAGDLYTACLPDSGTVYARIGSGEWSEVTGPQLMSMAAQARHPAAPSWLALDLKSTCKVDAEAAAQQQQVASTEPPDWSPLAPTALTVTGNWSSMEEEGGWSVWQMYRLGGADAYAACIPDSGSLQSKTHGGSWSSSTVQGLRSHFGFAPWYFVDIIMQEIGKTCGVHAPSQGPPGQQAVAQQQATAEPRADRDAGIPNTAGSSVMYRRPNPHSPTQERMVMGWSARNPQNWSARIRIHAESVGLSGRRLFAPGVVPVSVGGRTFNFVVPQHSSDEQYGSMRDHVWSVGTEATLRGAAAKSFYCAAKGSTVSFSVPMNYPRGETKDVTIYIREIDGFEEIADAHPSVSCE